MSTTTSGNVKNFLTIANIFFQKTNKKVPGKYKDETAGVPITEFVGLHSKMHSYSRREEYGDKKRKDIKKSVVRKVIKHRN